jgi:hypothetical protein
VFLQDSLKIISGTGRAGKNPKIDSARIARIVDFFTRQKLVHYLMGSVIKLNLLVLSTNNTD